MGSLLTDDDAYADSLRLPGLVGRAREVDEIQGLINDPRVRLLTLTGPAGVGKSRLAQEVLDLRMQGFGADGIGYSEFPDITVDLANTSSRLDVWNAVLDAFGYRRGDPDDGIAGVQRALALLESGIGTSRRVLLLDNCDLIAESIAPDLSVLLPHCPNLLVVATSRVVLNLHREYVVDIRPLRTRSEPGPSRPASSPAAQLLLAGIDSRYRSSAANRLLLDKIAHELDGVPLALELAAITINRIGSAHTLKLIRSGADLAPLPYVDVPVRHRSLHASVEWGMNRLDDSAVDVLLHLSLCESAVDPDTVSLMVGMAESSVGATLATLIGHSLLQRTVTDAGQPSYELIATVRAYCHRLLETDRARGERIRGHHVDRCSELALRVVRELDRHDQRALALNVAEQRVDDFLATVGRLIEMGRAQRAVELTALLEDVWIRFGYLSEIELTLTQFVENEYSATDPALPDALELLGKWALQSGRSHRAVDLFTRAAAAHHRLGDTGRAHRTAGWLGMAHLAVGRPAPAREQLLLASRNSDPDPRLCGEVIDIYLAALAMPDSSDAQDEQWSRIHQRARQLDTDVDRLRVCNALARNQLGADTAHRALDMYRCVLRFPDNGSHILETLTAVEGCAAAYRIAGPEFGESATALFGAVNHIRNAYAIPQSEDVGSEDVRATHLISPETTRDLRDIVACALSGPVIPAGSESPLDALTKRQREIALLVADGLTNRMIASRLGIAEWTVINHLRQVMAKLDCPSRLHVALVVKGEREPDGMAGNY